MRKGPAGARRTFESRPQLVGSAREDVPCTANPKPRGA